MKSLGPKSGTFEPPTVSENVRKSLPITDQTTSVMPPIKLAEIEDDDLYVLLKQARAYQFYYDTYAGETPTFKCKRTREELFLIIQDLSCGILTVIPKYLKKETR